MKSIRKENFKVRSYEINSRGQASIQSICRYLGEIAGNHANELGASVGVLRSKGLTWVLSRLHVQMKKYPLWGDTIRIETWPSGQKNYFALRDFLIYDRDELIGSATTSWMVIDLVKKKPVVLPDFIIRIPIPGRSRALDDSFEKLPVPDEITSCKAFNVRLSDLDTNQHVNFVNYIEWAIETVPAETWRDFRLEGLEVSYRAESRYGDRIISEAQEIKQDDRQIYLHCLHKEKDYLETAVLKTDWFPR
jgi:medium-chain acyl-[acyl-carrier-protein] hydrolase